MRLDLNDFFTGNQRTEFVASDELGGRLGPAKVGNLLHHPWLHFAHVGNGSNDPVNQEDRAVKGLFEAHDIASHLQLTVTLPFGVAVHGGYKHRVGEAFRHHALQLLGILLERGELGFEKSTRDRRGGIYVPGGSAPSFGGGIQGRGTWRIHPVNHDKENGMSACGIAPNTRITMVRHQP